MKGFYKKFRSHTFESSIKAPDVKLQLVIITDEYMYMLLPYYKNQNKIKHEVYL